MNSYETGLMDHDQLEDFIDFFDKKIGTDYDVNDDPAGSDRDLGIIADINGEDHFVFIDSGASLPLEEVLCLGWCFATTTVEAVWA